MAYLPQFEFDIFISYAHVDNAQLPGSNEGWVNTFHKHLEVELSRLIGRFGVLHTWRDRDIQGFQYFDVAIDDRLRSSAIFLALISPGYLSSQYCELELATFIKLAEPGDGVVVKRRSRVVPVLLYNLPYDSWPQEIKNLEIIGYPFYVSTGDDLGHPADLEDEIFYRQIRTLAREIFATLDSLRTGSQKEDKADEHDRPRTQPDEPPPSQARKPVSREETNVVTQTTKDSAKSTSAVFISYRRGDGTPYAGRLYDQLTARFGTDRVFMDLDTIEPGDDFVEVITNYVSSCSVLIALINKTWLDVKDDDGRPRLHNPDDFVHLEISIALQRKIRVIPVLVQGALMPRPQDLPASLAILSRRNALEISDSRWRSDVSKLISVLEKHL